MIGAPGPPRDPLAPPVARRRVGVAVTAGTVAKLALYSAAVTVLGASLAFSVADLLSGESELTVVGVVALVVFAALLERAVRRAWMLRPRRLELALGVAAGVAVGAVPAALAVYLLFLVLYGVEGR